MVRLGKKHHCTRAKKNRGSNKIKGRILTLPEMKAVFDAEDVERREKEKADKEKEAQKSIEALARNAQITQDIVLKVFDKPLTAYKRKDELVTIPGALKITATGTIPEVIARDHLIENPQLEQNSRFSGLFNTGCRRGPVSPPETTQLGQTTFPGAIDGIPQLQPPGHAQNQGPLPENLRRYPQSPQYLTRRPILHPILLLLFPIKLRM